MSKPSADNLIQNGDFQNSSPLSSWALHNSGPVHVSFGTDGSNNYVIMPSLTSISQEIHLEGSGPQPYEVSFSVWGGGVKRSIQLTVHADSPRYHYTAYAKTGAGQGVPDPNRKDWEIFTFRDKGEPNLEDIKGPATVTVTLHGTNDSRVDDVILIA